jgi:hypothetical protein
MLARLRLKQRSLAASLSLTNRRDSWLNVLRQQTSTLAIPGNNCCVTIANVIYLDSSRYYGRRKHNASFKRYSIQGKTKKVHLVANLQCAFRYYDHIHQHAKRAAASP